jgi:hypothetical protein
MSDVKKKYRKHFTLEEAARQFSVTVTDFLHAAEDDLITLCYRATYPRNVHIECEVWRDDTDDDTDEPMSEYRIETYQRNVSIGDYIPLPTEAIIKLSLSLPVLEAEYPCLKNDDEDLFFNTDNLNTITLNNVVILRDEVDRLTELQSEGSQLIPATTSDDTQLARAQKALSAIAYGLYNASPAYKHGNKPNVSAIVTMALGGTQDDNGQSNYGMGKTTLTNAINDAIKLYATDIEDNRTK